MILEAVVHSDVLPGSQSVHAIRSTTSCGSGRLARAWVDMCGDGGNTGRMVQRLQRSRRAGARLPAGTVVVTRPTKWGNPHSIGLGRAEAVRRYHDDLLTGRLTVTFEQVRQELGGRDLACYCPLSEPCHADVLIQIANGSATGIMG